MVLINLAPSSPDDEPEPAPLQQRVALLRKSIAEEQTAALNAAVSSLQPPDRGPKALSREQLRSVTSLPNCAHGLLGAALDEQQRPTSSRGPVVPKVARRVQTASGRSRSPTYRPSLKEINAESVERLRASLSLPNLEPASTAGAGSHVSQVVTPASPSQHTGRDLYIKLAAPAPLFARRGVDEGAAATLGEFSGAVPRGGKGGVEPQPRPRPQQQRHSDRRSAARSHVRLAPGAREAVRSPGTGATRGAAPFSSPREPAAPASASASASASAAALPLPPPPPPPPPAPARADAIASAAEAISPWGLTSDLAAPLALVSDMALDAAPTSPGRAAASTAPPPSARGGARGYTSAYGRPSAALQAARAAQVRAAGPPAGVRLAPPPRRLSSLAARRASPVEWLASAAEWNEGGARIRQANLGAAGVADRQQHGEALLAALHTLSGAPIGGGGGGGGMPPHPVRMASCASGAGATGDLGGGGVGGGGGAELMRSMQNMQEIMEADDRQMHAKFDLAASERTLACTKAAAAAAAAAAAHYGMCASRPQTSPQLATPAATGGFTATPTTWEPASWSAAPQCGPASGLAQTQPALMSRGGGTPKANRDWVRKQQTLEATVGADGMQGARAAALGEVFEASGSGLESTNFVQMSSMQRVLSSRGSSRGRPQSVQAVKRPWLANATPRAAAATAF